MDSATYWESFTRSETVQGPRNPLDTEKFIEQLKRAGVCVDRKTPLDQIVAQIRHDAQTHPASYLDSSEVPDGGE